MKNKIGETEVTKPGTRISRLNFLKWASLLTVSVLTGCSQIKYLTGSYPDKYKIDSDKNDFILRSFVITVIPGADENDPDLTKIFNDDYYSFKSFCGFFISDLCSKSKELFGTEEFHLLNETKRTFIIEQGLNDGAMMKRLYTAAIVMAQVSYYSGIYNPDAGCKLIDFPGTNSSYSEDEMFYQDTAKYFANEITNNGNYH